MIVTSHNLIFEIVAYVRQLPDCFIYSNQDFDGYLGKAFRIEGTVDDGFTLVMDFVNGRATYTLAEMQDEQSIATLKTWEPA